MKSAIIGLLISISTCSFGQKPDCLKFKNGNFKIVDEEHGNSYIERKGSKQVEYGEGSKLRLQFKVRWINECTYTLKLIKVLENPNEIDLSEEFILTVEIIETKENAYIQRSTSDKYEMILESELVKTD